MTLDKAIQRLKEVKSLKEVDSATSEVAELLMTVDRWELIVFVLNIRASVPESEWYVLMGSLTVALRKRELEQDGIND